MFDRLFASLSSWKSKRTNPSDRDKDLVARAQRLVAMNQGKRRVCLPDGRCIDLAGPGHWDGERYIDTPHVHDHDSVSVA